MSDSDKRNTQQYDNNTKRDKFTKRRKKIKTNLEDCLSGDVRRWFLLKQEELGRRRAIMRRKRLPIVVRIKQHQSI